MKVIAVVALAAICAGQAQASDKGLIKAVEKTLADTMLDPGSAQFRNVYVSKKSGWVCGETNAKNAYGGYVGFRRFISDPDLNAEIEPRNDNPEDIAAESRILQFGTRLIKNCSQ